MNTDKYIPRGTSRTSAVKRDTLAAELERDPQLSTSKRHQRTSLFTSTLSHASLERQLVALQTANSELETKLRERDVQIERLESDRRWLAEREKEEREERERERGVYDEEKRTTDTELRSLRTSLSSLHAELADLQDAHTSLSHTSSRAASTHQSTIATLTHQNTLLTTQLSAAQAQLSSVTQQLSSLQSQHDELLQSTAEHDRSMADHADLSVVRDELARQTTYLHTLERENGRIKAELAVLRERRESIEVLKEAKRGLEAKLQMMEEVRNKAVMLEAEVEAARKEREAWASSNPQPQTQTQTQTLSSLRLTHARLLESHGTTSALLAQRTAELASASKRQEELEQRIRGLEEDVRVAREDVRRRDGRVRVAEREVGFLQALVASYNAEAAQMAQSSSSASTSTDAASPSPQPQLQSQQIQHLTQRIAHLESLLAEYKSINDTLGEELDAVVGISGSLIPRRGGDGDARTLVGELEEVRRENVGLKETVASLTATSESHLAQIEQLSQRLFDLGGEIGGGRHVPPHTRVLSLADNPEQRWFDARRERVEALRRENEALLRRLREGGGESVPRESWEIVNKEKAELEDLLKQKEKRLLRLQQVYQSKSAEFREAIASLLGLKLAFYPNGQVRVTSIYDLCASFVFQPSRGSGAPGQAQPHPQTQTQTQPQGGTMQLVAQGEGGPQELPDLMRYWIENEQCIPGFLASVTLECYDKVKREGGGLSQGGGQG